LDIRAEGALNRLDPDRGGRLILFKPLAIWNTVGLRQASVGGCHEKIENFAQARAG
jgi:hypothetical protein